MSGKAPMKYVVVTGGVVSGLGKGVTASSVGVLLKAGGMGLTLVHFISAHFGTRCTG
jgi:CTP synthase